MEGHQNADSMFFQVLKTQNGAEVPRALIFRGQASMHAQTCRVSGAHGDTTWKLGLPGLDSQSQPMYHSPRRQPSMEKKNLIVL